MKLSIDERAIPIRDEVQGTCELLGLDPLYIANEGRFVTFVPEAQADHALAVMRGQALATEAVRVGEVDGRESSVVVLKTVLGTHRILDLLSGEQLPRIC